ncbi:MAG: hypothetical protein JWO03_4057 [Bacteroidetes bacterium]|nr:hypothetical protein [Bacteroidota bacterium]
MNRIITIAVLALILLCSCHDKDKDKITFNYILIHSMIEVAQPKQ